MLGLGLGLGFAHSVRGYVRVDLMPKLMLPASHNAEEHHVGKFSWGVCWIYIVANIFNAGVRVHIVIWWGVHIVIGWGVHIVICPINEGWYKGLM